MEREEGLQNFNYILFPEVHKVKLCPHQNWSLSFVRWLYKTKKIVVFNNGDDKIRKITNIKRITDYYSVVHLFLKGSGEQERATFYSYRNVCGE